MIQDIRERNVWNGLSYLFVLSWGYVQLTMTVLLGIYVMYVKYWIDVELGIFVLIMFNTNGQLEFIPKLQYSLFCCGPFVLMIVSNSHIWYNGIYLCGKIRKNNAENHAFSAISIIFRVQKNMTNPMGWRTAKFCTCTCWRQLRHSIRFYWYWLNSGTHHCLKAL